MVYIKAAVEATHGPEVLSDVGAFGGLFSLATLGLKEPVLVASTDGVGTKTLVAARTGRYGGPRDCVANTSVWM